MADPFYNPVIPGHVPEELVHDFNMYDPQEPGVDLFQSVRNLHERGLPKLFWTRHNGGHWIALKGDVITDVARDAETFSSVRMLVPDEQNFDVPFFVPLMSDPPDHGGYRSICTPMFTPKRIDELADEVQKLTNRLIDDLQPRGECEFMEDFALQMPIIVFLQLLDLPLEDRPRLLEIAKGVVSPDEGAMRDDAMQQMFNYLRPILADRVADPRDDVISRLVQGKHNGRDLSSDEMLGLAATLLSGGLDTVAASLGFFARYLAQNPEARLRLRGAPDKDVLVAVEELIRRFAVTTHGRLVRHDVDFHGVELHANDHITWMASMYNLDDSKFPDPMVVDFDRKRAPHMSFGSGIHFCVGSFLARMELHIFVNAWLERIPNFKVKPGFQVEYRPGINIAYESLPLVWDV